MTTQSVMEDHRKVFVAYRHTGEDPAELEAMLTPICERF